MKIECALLPVVFSLLFASTAYAAAGALAYLAEGGGQSADHSAPSSERSAAWRGIRTGCILAAAIAAVVLLAMNRGLGGLLPAAGGDPQSEVERLWGARLLQEQGWRPRDETGSVAGELVARESGEPDDYERILATSWAQPIH